MGLVEEQGTVSYIVWSSLISAGVLLENKKKEILAYKNKNEHTLGKKQEKCISQIIITNL